MILSVKQMIQLNLWAGSKKNLLKTSELFQEIKVKYLISRWLFWIMVKKVKVLKLNF